MCYLGFKDSNWGLHPNFFPPMEAKELLVLPFGIVNFVIYLRLPSSIIDFFRGYERYAYSGF